ncbi:dTDP-4-dehydrorhamnose 3,5-epimerase family protein [Streptomyces sp. M2CJ-2]|uniref:dTDP-4-dehydrorhamnose 3,5-epimerase family protein n=1 Tax=Streptomyces sp. M2CJ-2 TaxID=2803948 RepID=UPI001920C13E|nr:dTDP-4-dehydrorhamnose 3,5-epimerase family protein [Streptomyces sp. M2CJ-2]MBL3666099.1 dTDP-4-dehydrorhamnose 3,5-epimerase family protein [Streptomyces sp. M2CJ-2]
MRALESEGARVPEPEVFPDDRGVSHEWYLGGEFREATGCDLSLAQADCSVSRRGVPRGVRPRGPAPGISGPEGIDPVLSSKDEQAPPQAEAERLGLLPSYGACRARHEELRGRGLSG